MRRSDQRRAAVFALYEREVRHGPGSTQALDGARPFTRELGSGGEERQDELDTEIASLARGWDLERIAALEKCIMRVALYEIHHREDVPGEVAIDEAVGLAKRYCGADAPGFVNGILAAAQRTTPRA